MAAPLTSGRRARLGSPARATTAGLLLALAAAAPAAASGNATIDRIEGVETAIVVAMPDNFPIASISRADCDVVQLVTRPDGSA